MKSTTEIGDELREAVVSLLRASQKSSILVRERLLAGKKADIYYEEKAGFIEYKVAVECKNESTPLGNSYAASIYSDYLPALTQKEIDYVIVVTKKGLTTQADNVFLNDRRFIHKTYDEFRCEIMNFSQYLPYLESKFEEDGLSSYYISPQSKSGLGVEQVVDDWLKEDSCKPMAILAGYGMGKSSFAKYFVGRCAKEALIGTGRIPIYVQLGSISYEQRIEGLISSSLTAGWCAVGGYNFNLFNKMNEEGAFVIVLDGFDEMKHAMSFYDFKNMVIQFSRLVTGRSKVLILGRPNAFLSEDERKTVLHGMEKIGDTEILSAQMADFTEVHVENFSRGQILQFYSSYLKYLMGKNSRDRGMAYSDGFYDGRMNELKDDHFMELSERPVHAKMLVEISSSPDVALKKFTRYQLYEKFTDMFYERESGKRARQYIDVEIRRKFMSDLAWHLWRDCSSGAFDYKDVPKGFVSEVCDRISSSDHESVLRDLLTGSLVEQKDGGKYHFVHRSFHEFLISQRIVNRDWLPETVTDIAEETLNDEIVSFVSEAGDKGFYKRLSSAMNFYNGKVSLNFLRLYAGSLDSGARIPPSNTWDYISYVQSVIDVGGDVSGALDDMVAWLRSSREGASFPWMVLLAVCICAARRGPSVSLTEMVVALIIDWNVEFIRQANGVSGRRGRLGVSVGVDVVTRVFLGAISRSNSDASKGKSFSLQFDWEYLRRLFESDSGVPGISGNIGAPVEIPRVNVSVDQLGSYRDVLKMTSGGAGVVQFYKKYPSSSHLVSVSNKKMADKKRSVIQLKRKET